MVLLIRKYNQFEGKEDNGLLCMTLDKSAPLNLDHTLDCGQVFRWEKRNNLWYGIVGDIVIKVRCDGDKLLFQTFPEELGISFIHRYFRLDDDLPNITSKICKDTVIQRAINEFYGLRIIRQDPWECIISYICATFSNIPRIKGMVRNLSKKDRRFTATDAIYFSFPNDFFIFP